MASQLDPTDLPSNAAQLREQLVAATQAFFDSHGIRIKSRKLPVQLPVASSPAAAGSRGEGSGSARKASGRAQTESAAHACDGLSATSSLPLPLYHFITRQKFQMAEQLIRNKSCYMTPYNKKLDRRQRASPWIMQEMTDEVKKHLAQLSSDFDDREFSGVYISLHTAPYLVDCEYGNLSRSRIVGWALVELLTTNERCLKALWVHPSLSASSTRLVLQAFLPRILVEAVEFNTPGVKPLCPWRFFYCWLNDFDLMPRGSWLLLSASKYLGLPVHCDNLNVEEEEEVKEESKGKSGGGKTSGGCKGRGRPPAARPEKTKGKKKEEEELHVGHRDGDVGCACPCQHPSRWHDDFDEKLVGCTESFIYRNFGRILDLIPKSVDARLQDEIGVLPQENPEMAKKDPPETDEEIRLAETFGLDNETISRLLQKVYGSWSTGRFKYLDGDGDEDPRPHSRRRLNGLKPSTGREVLTTPD
ncbi:erythrocyte membrane related protein [Cystoisospora suis]|uniref:Erythrocyte membrane related protein n=1 Tax=Cystoisospora suis TaxID=483139 RepID=A0A2C6KE83_9APIC|nr:erythrocyte membrane related protein [Cystoisospora suis]